MKETARQRPSKKAIKTRRLVGAKTLKREGIWRVIRSDVRGAGVEVMAREGATQESYRKSHVSP